MTQRYSFSGKGVSPCFRWWCAVVVGLVIGAIPLGAASAPSPAPVNFPGKLLLQDGNLTARIVGIPLRQVMEEISRLSGAQVFWLNQDGEKLVSVDFANVPFSEALERILGEKNFLLFYSVAGEGTTLTQIWISSGEQGTAQRRLTPPSAAVRTATSVPMGDSIPHNGEGLDAVISTAMQDQDSTARINAVTQLGGYIQEDPQVKAILAQIAQSDSNPQVREAASELLTGVE